MDMKNKSSISSQDNFLDRQKNLNAKLEAIEKSLNKHTNHTDSRVPRLEELSGCSQRRNKIKGYRGKQSIFKRPEGPAPRSKVSVIPDYRKNPEKWKFYSLDDVSQMSNESNSQAAFDFLRELEERKLKKTRKLLEIKDKQRRSSDEAMDVDGDVDDDDDDDAEEEGSNALVTFRKPRKQKETSNKPMPEFKNNKIVLPEYEFGTKKAMKKKSQKTVAGKIDKSKEMKLDHLLDYEDDE